MPREFIPGRNRDAGGFNRLSNLISFKIQGREKKLMIWVRKLIFFISGDVQYFIKVIKLGYGTSIDYSLLVILVALEAILSADNAIALASISNGLSSRTLQRKALNIGLMLAFVLRMILIVTATWVIQFWQFELLGALYLLWLVFQYFTSKENDEDEFSRPQI
jgi:threonine/homoserine/homoserine lactone efflux protein